MIETSEQTAKATSVGIIELLAWEVELHSMTCVCFASTQAKAQWLATKSYWEAYGKNTWPRAKAWRAPQYDKSVLRFEKNQRAWSTDHVQSSGTR